MWLMVLKTLPPRIRRSSGYFALIMRVALFGTRRPIVETRTHFQFTNTYLDNMLQRAVPVQQ